MAEDKEKENEKDKEKKNEFEIYATYVSGLAKLAADQAMRWSELAKAVAPPRGDYSLGDFLLAQAQNSSKLIESYLKSATKCMSK
jgi:hypothetical protein